MKLNIFKFCAQMIKKQHASVVGWSLRRACDLELSSSLLRTAIGPTYSPIVLNIIFIYNIITIYGVLEKTFQSLVFKVVTLFRLEKPFLKLICR